MAAPRSRCRRWTSCNNGGFSMSKDLSERERAARLRRKRQRSRRLVERVGARLRLRYAIERRWAVARKTGFESHYGEAEAFLNSPDVKVWLQLARQVLRLRMDVG